MHNYLTRLACALPLLLFGCSATNPFTGSEFNATRSLPVLPYSVRVLETSIPLEFGDATAFDGGGLLIADNSVPSKGFLPPLIADVSSTREIGAHVGEALERFGTFSTITGYRDVSRLPADLDLQLTVSTRGPKIVERIELTNMIWPTLGLWFLLGAPGWFIDDVRYVQGIEIRYDVFDTGTSDLLLSRKVDLGDENVLNFARRAGWKQFLLQIVVPPFLTDRITPDLDRADRALYESYLSVIQSQVGGSLKRDLLRTLIRKGRPVLLVDTDVRGGPVAYVFSQAAVTALNVRPLDMDGEEMGRPLEASLENWAGDENNAELTRRFGLSLGKRATRRLADYDHLYEVDLSRFSELTLSELLVRIEAHFESEGQRSWTIRM